MKKKNITNININDTIQSNKHSREVKTKVRKRDTEHKTSASAEAIAAKNQHSEEENYMNHKKLITLLKDLQNKTNDTTRIIKIEAKSTFKFILYQNKHIQQIQTVSIQFNLTLNMDGNDHRIILLTHDNKINYRKNKHRTRNHIKYTIISTH